MSSRGTGRSRRARPDRPKGLLVLTRGAAGQGRARGDGDGPEGERIDVLAIDHVQVTVPPHAEAAAKRFYGLVLGLREIARPAVLAPLGGAWYETGLVQLHLSVEDAAASAAGASRRHVCFRVADLGLAERAMRAAGVEILPDAKPTPGWTRFYVRDPGGNRIEIAQTVPLS